MEHIKESKIFTHVNKVGYAYQKYIHTGAKSIPNPKKEVNLHTANHMFKQKEAIPFSREGWNSNLPEIVQTLKKLEINPLKQGDIFLKKTFLQH